MPIDPVQSIMSIIVSMEVHCIVIAFGARRILYSKTILYYNTNSKFASFYVVLLSFDEAFIL